MVTRAYEMLGTPVEGELRREPVADADVPCPCCGGREWLLIERRAEPEAPFTRWRALACAGCGAADGWTSAGRARPGRSERRAADEVPGMPDIPTVADVSRLASFRVYVPGPSAKLCSSSHEEGRLTGIMVAAGGVEVTTEIRHGILYSLPFEFPPEHRARHRLEELLDDWPTDLPNPTSEPALELQMADASRRAEARAAKARTLEAMVDVDGASVRFVQVDHEGCWAAVADIGDESITIAAREVPIAGVALKTVSSD